MIANKIKFIADLLMSFAQPGADAGKNYKQLSLGIAIIICLIGFIVITLLVVAGTMYLIKST